MEPDMLSLPGQEGGLHPVLRAAVRNRVSHLLCAKEQLRNVPGSLQPAAGLLPATQLPSQVRAVQSRPLLQQAGGDGAGVRIVRRSRGPKAAAPLLRGGGAGVQLLGHEETGQSLQASRNGVPTGSGEAAPDEVFQQSTQAQLQFVQHRRQLLASRHSPEKKQR